MKDRFSATSAPSSSEKGFSLIEVAIVVAIIGLLLTPFIMEYNNAEKLRKINLSKTNTELASEALRKYAISYGRYPRPANPSVPNGTRTMAGSVEYGSGDEQPNETSTPVAAPAYAACPTDPSQSLTSVCRGAGSRDTLADADTSAANDYVFVGTLPYATLGLNETDAVDGFGNKLSYTVSAYLTRGAPSVFNDEFGTIRITDNANVPFDTPADSRAHFVVISHGAAGVGAYNKQGQQNIRCGPTTQRRDNNNCNYDGRFDDGRFTYDYIDSTGTTQTARVITRFNDTTNSAWDNYLAYTDNPLPGLWKPLANTPDMIANNIDAMRINTTEKDNRIRVDVGGNVRAQSVYTPNLCEAGAQQDTCMATIDVGRDTAPPLRPNRDTNSTGLRCAAYSAMTGISSGNEICDPLATTNIGSFTYACVTGTYPVGITAAGVVTCDTP